MLKRDESHDKVMNSMTFPASIWLDQYLINTSCKHE